MLTWNIISGSTFASATDAVVWTMIENTVKHVISDAAVIIAQLQSIGYGRTEFDARLVTNRQCRQFCIQIAVKHDFICIPTKETLIRSSIIWGESSRISIHTLFLAKLNTKLSKYFIILVNQYGGAHWHVHWSWGTSTSVSTWMGDRQWSPGTVNLGPFVGCT